MCPAKYRESSGESSQNAIEREGPRTYFLADGPARSTIERIFIRRSKAHERENLYCMFHIVAWHIVHGSVRCVRRYIVTSHHGGYARQYILCATLRGLRSPIALLDPPSSLPRPFAMQRRSELAR